MKEILLGVVCAALLVAVFAALWNRRGGGEAEAALSPLEEAYMTEEDRFVTVGGVRVRVREEGPRRAPVLLMMHGFTSSLETWDSVAERLSEEYRVIRFDLLGHGLTGPDPQRRYSPAERAAFTGAVMDGLGIARATLVGNSLGGLAAWRFASDNPERVSALVLISPGAYSINGVTEKPAPIPPATAIFLRTAPEAGLRAVAAGIYADPSAVPAARMALMRDMMRREGNGEAFIHSLEEFTLPDPDPDLRRLEMPVLVLWGRSDRLIPPRQGERMAKIIPDVRLVMLSGVGHAAQEESPARVAKEIEDFLAETETP
ncbi:alpha/beta fold hydrolase [Parvularcula oceani]|uniref:alpha/beta fold hydrolase n=1 Tax=Parvularcula oceani TaxID=1247963 RepID=UPI000569E3E9|nr:alpha/beta hydrolase [Parvularcula oceani]